MRRGFPGLFVLLPVLLAGAARAEGGEDLDPELPYRARRSNPVTYDVDFSAIVTPPYGTKTLKVWLPLPQNDAGQEVSGRDLTGFPTAVAPRVGREPTFGNVFAYFEFADPRGAQIVRHRFKVKVWELRWDVDPAKVARVDEWPAGFRPYLGGAGGRFRDLAAAIVPRRRDPASDLADVFAWVRANMTYDHTNASLRASAEHALEQRRGHCSDYHGLCAALGRSLGYPTRVTYGINPFPKNSPSHCKLEAFLPPYGWVSYDVSETQKLLASLRADEKLDGATRGRLARAANERFLKGFRDNTWFLQTRGTDYDLAPPARRRVAVVRTVYAEADGVTLPDPDPANPDKREFAWMTVHKYTPDRPVTNPFTDRESLLK